MPSGRSRKPRRPAEAGLDLHPSRAEVRLVLLFLEYLRRNEMLLRGDGEFRFSDDTLVALALLVAESDARQKDLMIRLILNLPDDEGATRQ